MMNGSAKHETAARKLPRLDSRFCPSSAGRHTGAFTLVEVAMSLAVTGLVFCGILAGCLHCTTLALR
jgi:hypothetical protein